MFVRCCLLFVYVVDSLCSIILDLWMLYLVCSSCGVAGVNVLKLDKSWNYVITVQG